MGNIGQTNRLRLNSVLSIFYSATTTVIDRGFNFLVRSLRNSCCPKGAPCSLHGSFLYLSFWALKSFLSPAREKCATQVNRSYFRRQSIEVQKMAPRELHPSTHSCAGRRRRDLQINRWRQFTKATTPFPKRCAHICRQLQKLPVEFSVVAKPASRNTCHSPAPHVDAKCHPPKENS